MSANASTLGTSAAHAITEPKRGFGLVDKLGATICFIIIFAVALGGLLNYFNFGKTYGQIVQSRFTVLVKDLVHTVDYGLGLGLSLKAMNNIPHLLDQAKAADKQINFIEVFDNTGRVLYSTKKNTVGAAVPPGWLAASDDTVVDATWSLETDDSSLVGHQLFNDFNQREGVLVLGYSRAPVAKATRDVLYTLLTNATITVGAFAVLAVLCAFLITRGLMRSIRRMHASLERTLAGGEPTMSEADVHDTLELEFCQFQETVQTALQEADAHVAESESPRKDGSTDPNAE